MDFLIYGQFYEFYFMKQIIQRPHKKVYCTICYLLPKKKIYRLSFLVIIHNFISPALKTPHPEKEKATANSYSGFTLFFSYYYITLSK